MFVMPGGLGLRRRADRDAGSDVAYLIDRRDAPAAEVGACEVPAGGPDGVRAIGLHVLAGHFGLESQIAPPAVAVASTHRTGVYESYVLRNVARLRHRRRSAEPDRPAEVTMFSWAATVRGAADLEMLANPGGANVLAVMRPSAISSDCYLDMLNERVRERVVITGRRHRGPGRSEEFLRIELHSAVVGAHTRVWDVVRNEPADAVALIGETVRYRYHPQNMDGSYGSPVVAMWRR